MWHENIEEMMEMLKSIFRLDRDYSARRLAQKYLAYVDPDFYEWETHFLFDDAFALGKNDEEQQEVNSYVKQLVCILINYCCKQLHCAWFDLVSFLKSVICSYFSILNRLKLWMKLAHLCMGEKLE